MTQAQLERAVARSTGESVQTVRHRGFRIQNIVTPLSQLTDDLCLVVDCPFCGRPVPYPGRAGDGSATLAECDRDDVYFEFDPAEVYATPAIGE